MIHTPVVPGPPDPSRLAPSLSGSGVRPPAPTGPGSEITGESLDGEHVSLADFRGKRVLLNVWSSW